MNPSSTEPRPTVDSSLNILESRIAGVEELTSKLIGRLETYLYPDSPPVKAAIERTAPAQAPVIVRIQVDSERLLTILTKLDRMHERLALE